MNLTEERLDKLEDLIDTYSKLNNWIVDEFPSMYDRNYYDIRGYIDEINDEVEFTEDDYNHLAKRIIALRKFIEANEELWGYGTKYA